MNNLCSTRRDFLKAMSSGAAAMAVPGVLSFCTASANKPNIVLIMADDLGYECLGCYGSTSYKTPVLDELASTGIRFDHCYVQPLCTPTRVQLMTGQYNFRNYRAFGILDPKEKTFGHVLKDAGYATYVAGKWQLYGSSSRVTAHEKLCGTGTYPDKAGFDEYCLWQIEESGSRYADPMIKINSKSIKEFKGKYGPDVCCDYILDFMERNKKRPFFVYYPMILTHAPFVPTPDSKEWNENKRNKRNNKYFADMVAYMDKIVGRIIRKLDELGLRENTLVMFLGDNGTHRNISSKIGNRIIQGGKGTTTDAGMRVPFIANWKGTIPPGKICGDLIDSTDFLPTVAEIGGASLPEKMMIDGRSFLPQLRGGKGSPREWIFCHYLPKFGIDYQKKEKVIRFARNKRWKLYNDGRLFDIPVDVLEENPIMPGQGSKEAAEARKKLQAVFDSMK